MNLPELLRSAIANTFRSKLRTGLTVVAIFIGAFTLTITSAIGTGVSNYIDSQVSALGADDILTISKSADAAASTDDGPAEYEEGTAASAGAPAAPGFGGEPLTESDLDTIAGVEGIESVDPLVLVSPDWIEAGGDGKYEVSVNTASGFTDADLAAGEQLDQTTDDPQLLVPTDYVEALGGDEPADVVGETVTFGITDYLGEQHETTATIVGVQNETLLGGGVSLNQSLSDELYGLQTTGRPADLGESYTAATARFDPDSSPAALTDLKERLADDGYSAQTVEDQVGMFQLVIDGIVGVLNAFAVIALLAAGFGIINTLLMSVQERTREIGLMKAMGMGGGRIYALFSLEAVFIGFLGSAIGAVVAIGVGTLISGALADTVLSGLPGLQIMQFDPVSVGVVILIVMLLAFLAGTLPARRAARQNPIDALRYE